MEEQIDQALIPDEVRRIMSLVLTLVAITLYALVLGRAIVITMIEPAPQFSSNMIRAASLLGGLVGSVVTAGFARSQRPGSVHLSAGHPMGGNALTKWTSLRSPFLLRRKFQGLADTLGFYVEALPVSRVAPGEDETPRPEGGLTTAAWIALVYFAVYFVVGMAAFLVTFWKVAVPEVVATSGWIWLGTAISSAYTFLGIDGRS